MARLLDCCSVTFPPSSGFRACVMDGGSLRKISKAACLSLEKYLLVSGLVLRPKKPVRPIASTNLVHGTDTLAGCGAARQPSLCQDPVCRRLKRWVLQAGQPRENIKLDTGSLRLLVSKDTVQRDRGRYWKLASGL